MLSSSPKYSGSVFIFLIFESSISAGYSAKIYLVILSTASFKICGKYTYSFSLVSVFVFSDFLRYTRYTASGFDTDALISAPGFSPLTDAISSLFVSK